MSVNVFIDGGAGTTGIEIRDRLAGHTDVAVIVLDEARRKDPAARAEALNDADVVILCLPDDAAREAVSLIRNDRTKVIDASTAHRVDPTWAYGFAELEPDSREKLTEAMRVSNPGCYPTGFLALVRPLVRAGLLPADWPLSVNATSGYSGGGKALIAAFEDPNAPDATDTAFRIYGLNLAHKHVPEMTTHAGLSVAPIFLPAVAHTLRGMIVEVPLHLHALPTRPDIAAIRALLAETYQGSTLVQVDQDEHAILRIEDVAGTDLLRLYVFGNEKTGQGRLVALLDNLGKGASGAAVQNLNLMAGLGETTGLQL
ncbi:N-acetyl-gamma-glutamyl-phosphate reductase [Flavisphingomonas formosensis]|uniref:N-acetyl-gamma-glutamyl-phosphate reductase n=1 Tax=Flavisphingomonas formosensis TaxID=861534 RepID=UPI0012F88290|nr:N-acetyl-gamma-glutamyl-phosphate reductase [Sphingomonas formosensis]